MRRSARAVLFLVSLFPCLLVSLSPGHAAPRVEADPNREYPVVAEAGPWMICAASFTGPNAPRYAHEIVLLLRSRDHLPAYVFNRGERERQKQREEVERLRQTLPPGTRIPMHRIPDECVVLVGGYPDMETARKALERVKQLDPPPEHLMDRLSIAGGEPVPGSDKKEVVIRRGFINPFQFRSFVVPNPLVPVQKPERDKYAVLKQFNEEEDYSLLKCPRPWTLAVKEYAGASVVQSRSAPNPFLNLLGMGGKSETLSATAMMAHELARVLRELKFEAYVLHTPHSSLVTVGSFDSDNDPRIGDVQQRLVALRQRQIQTSGQDPLQLQPQAVPIPVPRPAR